MLEDLGAAPLRVTSLRARLAGVAPSAVDVSFEVRAVPHGSTTGELSASGPLTRLLPGRVLARAVGATVRPVGRSGLWYVVVIRLRVTADVTRPWSIAGLFVTYAIGSRHRAVFLPQHVTLRMARSCAAAHSA